MIYEKTPLGVKEISGDTRTLSLRERQVLILADGKRSESDLIEYFQKAETKDILLSLLARGYIQTKQDSLMAQTKPPTLPAQPLTLPVKPIAAQNTVIPAVEKKPEQQLSEADVNQLKEIIIKSTDCYLGIMGRPIKQKLELANSLDKLKPIISEWHMALRESKNGKEFAANLLHDAEHIIFKHLENV